MANMETKNLRVPPDQEDASIKLMQRYGWQLFASNEIFNKDSHEELRGEKVYSVTETTNFIKLVFQRDKSDAKYADYVTLEKLDNDFAAIEKPYPGEEKKVGGGAKWFFLIGLALWIICGLSGNGILFIGTLLLFVAGIVYIILRIKSYSKREAARVESLNRRTKEYEEKTAPILAEISAVEAKLNG